MTCDEQLTPDSLVEGIARMLVDEVIIPVALQIVGELEQVDGLDVLDLAVECDERN